MVRFLEAAQSDQADASHYEVADIPQGPDDQPKLLISARRVQLLIGVP